MLDVAENPRAVAGGNMPPADEPKKLTPYEAMKVHIEDLYDEAAGFLDGEPVTTQAQADAIDKIKALALEAEKQGDEQRRVEAKPFDDGKKAVQERWNPLVHKDTGKCRQIIQTCGKALAPFLIAEQKNIDDAAAEARRIADAAAEEALAKHAAANPENLSERAEAEDALTFAALADTLANRAEKGRAQAKGGRRATSLVSVWSAAVTDRRAALNHYVKTQPDEFEALIQTLADREARNGPRTAPGITFTEKQEPR